MNAPENFSKVIDGKRYNVATATLIAHNCYWDGSNFERQGRNTFLYRTAKGRYFAVHLTQWQGESDTLIPLSESDARNEYENLREHEVEYEEAFPEFAVEEA